MKYVLILTLICLSQSLQANEIRDLHEFDGTTPILGLMDEPIAESFFKRDMQSSYQSGHEYRSSFQLDRSLAARGVEALLINDYDAINAFIISAVDMDNGSKNFLVQVPAYEVMTVDVTLLSEYDHVLIMSMIPYRIQLDVAVEQEGMLTQSLQVHPPEPLPSAQSSMELDGCGSLDFMTWVLVTNTNGPSEGGSKIAVIDIRTRTKDGQNNVIIKLNVYYPDFGVKWHEGRDDNQCNPNADPPETPEDYFVTNSRITGRQVNWSDVGAALKGEPDPGTAVCDIAYDPNYPCMVDTNGDDERDAKATWSVVPTVPKAQSYPSR